MAKESESIIYQGDNGNIKMNVFFHEETFWMTQRRIIDLFGVKPPAIIKHFNNIFERGGLIEDSVSSILEQPSEDGNNYKTTFCNPDPLWGLISNMEVKKI